MSEAAQNGSGGGGLLGVLGQLADGLIGAAQERVELAREDLRAEKARFLESLLLALAVVGLGLLALGLATVAVLFLAWSRGGFLLAVAALAVAYGAGAWAAWLGLRRRMENAPFEVFATQLERDRRRVGRFN